jgi:hypothetical protein
VSEQLAGIVEATISKEVGADAFAVGPPQVRLMAARAAVGRLCWGAMFYECDTCGFGWEIWTALGVEGPPALREAGLYLSSAFMLGRCWAWPIDENPAPGSPPPHLRTCDGNMGHRDWSRDQEWGAPRIAPDDVPRFVLPREVWRGDQGADLEVPEPALVRARRWHQERLEERDTGNFS